MQNHYTTLSVPRDATPEQVRRAYHHKMKSTHPDTGGDVEQCLALQRAYETLRDPSRRRKYDETGDDSVFDARKMLAGMFAQAAEALFESSFRDIDLVEVIRKQVTVGQTHARSTAAKHRANASRYRQTAGKLTVVDGGDNPVVAALEAHAVNCERQAVALEADAAKGDAILAELARYRYEMEPQPQTTGFAGSWVRFQ